MNKSIHKSKEICNRLRENNLMETISEYALGYIVSILITTFSYGYRGKTVDIARNSERHRTSISRFLRYGKWDDSVLEKAMRNVVINIIYEEFRRSGANSIHFRRYHILQNYPLIKSVTSDRNSIFSLLTPEKETGLRTSGCQCDVIM